jgi:hypothetical protein
MVGVGGMLVAVAGALIAVELPTTDSEHPDKTTVDAIIIFTSNEIRKDMNTPLISQNYKLTSWAVG